ncbi:MAG: hypothetical protein ACOX3T_03630 [Bdellovibrionota bacterium]|jgi:hypothetical protein
MLNEVRQELLVINTQGQLVGIKCDNGANYPVFGRKDFPEYLHAKIYKGNLDWLHTMDVTFEPNTAREETCRCFLDTRFMNLQAIEIITVEIDLRKCAIASSESQLIDNVLVEVYNGEQGKAGGKRFLSKASPLDGIIYAPDYSSETGVVKMPEGEIEVYSELFGTKWDKKYEIAYTDGDVEVPR